MPKPITKREQVTNTVRSLVVNVNAATEFVHKATLFSEAARTGEHCEHVTEWYNMRYRYWRDRKAKTVERLEELGHKIW